jgi:hypothetical protein
MAAVEDRQDLLVTMRITRLDSQVLHVPLSRPRASPTEAGRLNRLIIVLVHVHTDAGLTGLGFAYALQGSGPPRTYRLTG